MNLLIDTNVVLDYLLRREPFYESAAKLVLLSEKRYIDSFISATSVTDIFYIAKKELKNKEKVFELIKSILKTVRVASVNEKSIYEALELKWNDFEDSVQYVVGENIFAEYIITRNSKDFINYKETIKINSPEEFLDLITNKD